MFSLGMSEILVIALIALMVIKPKDVPKIARKIGQFFKMITDYRDSFMEEIDSVKNLSESKESDSSEKQNKKPDEE